VAAVLVLPYQPANVDLEVAVQNGDPLQRVEESQKLVVVVRTQIGLDDEGVLQRVLDVAERVIDDDGAARVLPDARE